MNILHIIFSFNNGGSENLIVDLLNSWENKDDNLYLCIVNNFYDKNLLKKIQNKKVTIITLNREVSGNKIEGMKRLRRIVKKEKINVIHCHSVNVFNYTFLALGFSLKRKYILTIHNDTIYKSLSKVMVLFHKIFLHKITAISESVKESILEKNFPKKKIDIIYNGIDLRKYQREHIFHEKLTLLCVGRMVPQIKGQNILVKALKKITEVYPDIQCIFIGDNPEEHNYIDEMKKLAMQVGVFNNVVFIGNCHDVPREMLKADILIVPSREEGFGLVAIEAMASKIPVIASKTGGLVEIIEDLKTGYLFEKDDSDMLADKILQVLNTDQEKLIEAAFDMVKNRFDIINTVKEMRKSYV